MAALSILIAVLIIMGFVAGPAALFGMFFAIGEILWSSPIGCAVLVLAIISVVARIALS